MNILSIDASTHSTGWSIFNDDQLVVYGCIQSASTNLIKRIYIMKDGLEAVLNNYEIDKIILEEVRPEQGLQNLKTHKALLYLQAAITFLVYEKFNKIKIEYIYPSEWRKACGIKTGRGIRRDALKPLDIAFVKEKFGIEVNDDIADAIGIAVGYLNTRNNEINWE